MIVRARNVVTMDGAPISDGAVRVHQDQVVEVRKFSELGALSSVVGEKEAIVDLSDSVLLPGLINAHCHLDYTCLRDKISRQSSFADWIRLINAEKEDLTGNDYKRSVAEGCAEAQRFGMDTDSIAKAVSTAIVGQVSSSIQQGDRVMNIRVMLDPEYPAFVMEMVVLKHG